MKEHDPTERLSRGERAARLGIAGLSLIGVADALYMLAYDEGLIDSLVCPFFGEGCNIVGRSEHATHFGVPNAVVGTLGYAAMAALALWSGDKPPERRPVQSLSLAAIAAAAFGTSIYLTWEQAAKVKAWCFWCLLSAGINLAIVPLASRDGWTSLRAIITLRT